MKYSLGMNFFQNMISSIMKNGLSLRGFRAQNFGTLHKDINKAADSVMSTTGEVSSIVFAEHLLELISEQTDEELLIFLNYLLKEYDIDLLLLNSHMSPYTPPSSSSTGPFFVFFSLFFFMPFVLFFVCVFVAVFASSPS
mgnify:CR=1 FL=1